MIMILSSHILYEIIRIYDDYQTFEWVAYNVDLK
jgi:hypothetical protein